MISIRRHAAGFAAFFLCSGAVAGGLTDFDIEHSRFELDNGLTVIVVEDHSAPTVRVAVTYKVGSRDEPKRRSGFAHLFEHLMFSGSGNSDRSHFDSIREIGGGPNGTTSPDQTRYHETVPSNGLERVLWLEADRMGFLLDALTQDKLDKQRGVVQNEKRKGQDSPGGQLRDAFLSSLYPEGHPYRWPTIGSMEDLNAATLSDTIDFFNQFYGPNNAVLTVAGDTTPAEVRKFVQRYFANLEPIPQPNRVKAMLPYRAHNTRETLFDAVSSPQLNRTWLAPGLASKDHAMLTLVTSILSSDTNSWLQQSLMEEQKLAAKLSFYAIGAELASTSALTVTLSNDSDPAAVGKRVDATMERFIKDGPTAEQLQLAKLRYENQLVRQSMFAGGRVRRLTESEVLVGDAEHYKKVARWIDAATGGDLQAAARRWLTTGYHEILQYPEPTRRAVETDLDRSIQPPLGPYSATEPPFIRRARLSNGINVHLMENHLVPMINVAATAGKLLTADAEFGPAVPDILGALASSATNSLPEDEFKTALTRAGAEVGASRSLDQLILKASFLSSRRDGGLSLFTDMLRNPRLDAAGFEKVRSLRLNKQLTDESGMSQGVLSIPRLLYGDRHPYRNQFRMSGNSSDLKRLSLHDVQEFHARWIRPENLTVFVAGDITMQQLLPMLESALGRWESEAAPMATELTIPEVPPPATRVILFDRPGARQSSITLATLVPIEAGLDDAALLAANGVFGAGFSSRLNMNIREEKGWAYGASSQVLETPGQGVWAGGAKVQSDKTVAAMQEIWREYLEFGTTRPVTAGELDGYVGQKAKALASSLRSNFAKIRYMVGIEEYGRPDSYLLLESAALNALDADDVTTTWKTNLKPENTIWVVTGALERIEADIRAAGLGDVEVYDGLGEKVR